MAKKALMIERVCKVCGKHFEIPDYDARRRKAIYCSKKCRGQDMVGGTSWNAGVPWSPEMREACMADKVPYEEHACRHCGKTFLVSPSNVRRGSNDKYCSRACSDKSSKGRKPWNTGKKLSAEHRRKVGLAGLGRKSSKKGKKYPEHSMENHHNWQGGRNNSHGYIRVKCPGHPRAAKNGYVPEHFLIVEGVIGRPLERVWVIHHINEDKKDNRPENLFIFPSNYLHSRYHCLKRKGYLDAITESNLTAIRDNPDKTFKLKMVTSFT